MNNESLDVICPICKKPSTFPIRAQPLDYEYFTIPQRELLVRHCRYCGSRFLSPRPTFEELVSFYPDNYHAYNDDNGRFVTALVEHRAKSRAREYSRRCKKEPIRLFDVGSGDCRHFKAISRHGNFEFSGVEINKRMVETSRKNGYTIFEGTLEDLDISAIAGTFDVVTMYQLFEHVLDPEKLLVKAFDLLRPGGFVFGLLPSMDSWERRLFGRFWEGYHYPRHLQMVSKKGLKKMFLRNGYTNVRVGSVLHLQAGLSLQCLIVGLGYRKNMQFGKLPIYPLLLLAAVPFCIIEHLFGQGGMMQFRAQKQ